MAFEVFFNSLFNLDILKEIADYLEPEVKVGSPLFTKIQKIDNHLTATSIGRDNPPEKIWWTSPRR
jgi:hypothetical protein